MRVIWRVQTPATGPFASFSRRGWPQASYPDGRMAAMILCEDHYTAERKRTGKHAPLKVWVADYRQTPWKWRALKGAFPTYEQAKDGLARCLAAIPDLSPKEETNVQGSAAEGGSVSAHSD